MFLDMRLYENILVNTGKFFNFWNETVVFIVVYFLFDKIAERVEIIFMEQKIGASQEGGRI